MSNISIECRRHVEVEATLRLALEALEICQVISEDGEVLTPKKVQKAVKAIKEALAQPEPSPEWMTEEEQTAYTFGWFKALESKRMAQPEQEPIGEVVTAGVIRWKDKYPSLGTKLYTTPPPVPEAHKRKPLTDEEIWDAYMKAPVDIDCHVSDLHKFARAIEAAHGIKEDV